MGNIKNNLKSRRQKSSRFPPKIKSKSKRRKSRHEKTRVKSKRRKSSTYKKKSKALLRGSLKYLSPSPYPYKKSPLSNNSVSNNSVSNITISSQSVPLLSEGKDTGLGSLPVEMLRLLASNLLNNGYYGGTISLYDLYLLITEKYHSLTNKLPPLLKHYNKYRISSKFLLKHLSAAEDITEFYKPTNIIHINSNYGIINNDYFWDISNWAGPNIFTNVQLIMINNEKTNLQNLLKQTTFWNNLHSLTALNLAFNKIGVVVDGTTYLNSALEQLTNLTSLNLAGNQLQDIDIEVISPALEKLTKVTTLDLSGNDLRIDWVLDLINPLAKLIDLTTLDLRLNRSFRDFDISMLKSRISSPGRNITIILSDDLRIIT